MTNTLNRIYDETRIRAAFPVLQEVVYLNVGTYGIMPEPALTYFQTIQAEFERRGFASDGGYYQKTEEARRRIAALIGATADEIAFTRNATDGINLVLSGLDWQPGDEVITSDEEHPAMLNPLMYLHVRKGIRIIRLKVSPQVEVMLQRLEEVKTPRTRLLAMSLVSPESGTRLPGRAMVEWARSHNLLTLFDGAQASGAIPVDVRQIGCDFYASNGHKWLCGPKGTGFFYGRLEKLPLLSPAFVGAGSLQRIDPVQGIAEPFATSQRFEFGTRAWALTAGLNGSLDWFEQLGWQNVYQHTANLSDYLKDQILQRPHLTLISPRSFEESSGLVSFSITGQQADEVSTSLCQGYRIYVRIVPQYNAIRISTAHFNTVEDIQRLMNAIDRIANA